MSRVFFSSLSNIDYNGGSIDPLSLNPTVYFQVFDTSYLTPTNPTIGTDITEIRKYDNNSYILSATTCDSGLGVFNPTYETINSKNTLYFPGLPGVCFPPPCSVDCSTYYTTNQDIGFVSQSGYSFTLYFVGKPLSGNTVNCSVIINSNIDDSLVNNYLTVKNNKNFYFVSEISNGIFGYLPILNVPIEINNTSSELNSKDLRIFSVRAQDTRDLISTAAVSYINGIQTTAVTQSFVNDNISAGNPTNLGGAESIFIENSDSYQGYFGELIIFNTMHSTDTHSKIITFLKNRWGIV